MPARKVPFTLLGPGNNSKAPRKILVIMGSPERKHLPGGKEPRDLRKEPSTASTTTIKEPQVLIHPLGISWREN